MQICKMKYFSFLRNSFTRHYCQQAVRVRFAPSPTGDLHLGGIRTALYNYLFAKSRNGTFLLRIEDTDRERLQTEAKKNIIEDLAWCGIEFDEEVVTQSDRISIYQDYAAQLMKKGYAYRCFCTESEMNLRKKTALKMGEVPKYDNRCRHIPEEQVAEKLLKGEPSCIRFKLETLNEPIKDLICQEKVLDIFSNEGDPVILKGDGFPTYHFANVVDDHLMGISHVLRGIEWLSSTPKHLLLYKAFNWEPPKFGHLPLILNADGTKMSKRNEGISIREIRESGIFPLAVINLITKAGGGFNIDFNDRFSKSFTMEDFINNFDLQKVNTNGSKLYIEELKTFNQLEIDRLLKTSEGTKFLVKLVREKVTKFYLEKNQFSVHLQDLLANDEFITKILQRCGRRLCKVEDLVSETYQFLWNSELHDENYAVKESLEYETLESMRNDISRLDFNAKNIKAFVEDFSKTHQINTVLLMKFLRELLTGLKKGLPVADIMEILGKEATLRKLDKIISSKVKI